MEKRPKTKLEEIRELPSVKKLIDTYTAQANNGTEDEKRSAREALKDLSNPTKLLKIFKDRLDDVYNSGDAEVVQKLTKLIPEDSSVESSITLEAQATTKEEDPLPTPETYEDFDPIREPVSSATNEIFDQPVVSASPEKDPRDFDPRILDEATPLVSPDELPAFDNEPTSEAGEAKTFSLSETPLGEKVAGYETAVKDQADRWQGYAANSLGTEKFITPKKVSTDRGIIYKIPKGIGAEILRDAKEGIKKAGKAVAEGFSSGPKMSSFGLAGMENLAKEVESESAPQIAVIEKPQEGLTHDNKLAYEKYRQAAEEEAVRLQNLSDRAKRESIDQTSIAPLPPKTPEAIITPEMHTKLNALGWKNVDLMSRDMTVKMVQGIIDAGLKHDAAFPQDRYNPAKKVEGFDKNPTAESLMAYERYSQAATGQAAAWEAQSENSKGMEFTKEKAKPKTTTAPWEKQAPIKKDLSATEQKEQDRRDLEKKRRMEILSSPKVIEERRLMSKRSRNPELDLMMLETDPLEYFTKKLKAFEKVPGSKESPEAALSRKAMLDNYKGLTDLTKKIYAKYKPLLEALSATPVPATPENIVPQIIVGTEISYNGGKYKVTEVPADLATGRYRIEGAKNVAFKPLFSELEELVKTGKAVIEKPEWTDIDEAELEAIEKELAEIERLEAGEVVFSTKYMEDKTRTLIGTMPEIKDLKLQLKGSAEELSIDMEIVAKKVWDLPIAIKATFENKNGTISIKGEPKVESGYLLKDFAKSLLSKIEAGLKDFSETGKTVKTIKIEGGELKVTFN
jgi:hypothetical protein